MISYQHYRRLLHRLGQSGYGDIVQVLTSAEPMWNRPPLFFGLSDRWVSDYEEFPHIILWHRSGLDHARILAAHESLLSVSVEICEGCTLTEANCQC